MKQAPHPGEGVGVGSGDRVFAPQHQPVQFGECLVGAAPRRARGELTCQLPLHPEQVADVLPGERRHHESAPRTAVTKPSLDSRSRPSRTGVIDTPTASAIGSILRYSLRRRFPDMICSRT